MTIVERRGLTTEPWDTLMEFRREEEEPGKETQGEGGKTHGGGCSGCQVKNMFERPEQIN